MCPLIYCEKDKDLRIPPLDFLSKTIKWGYSVNTQARPRGLMKKKQHGGARPGAGRPPGRSATSISISVPVAIKEKLDELPYGDRSALIVQFLKQYFEA